MLAIDKTISIRAKSNRLYLFSFSLSFLFLSIFLFLLFFISELRVRVMCDKSVTVT